MYFLFYVSLNIYPFSPLYFSPCPSLYAYILFFSYFSLFNFLRIFLSSSSSLFPSIPFSPYFSLYPTLSSLWPSLYLSILFCIFFYYSLFNFLRIFLCLFSSLFSPIPVSPYFISPLFSLRALLSISLFYSASLPHYLPLTLSSYIFLFIFFSIFSDTCLSIFPLQPSLFPPCPSLFSLFYSVSLPLSLLLTSSSHISLFIFFSTFFSGPLGLSQPPMRLHGAYLFSSVLS